MKKLILLIAILSSIGVVYADKLTDYGLCGWTLQVEATVEQNTLLKQLKIDKFNKLADNALIDNISNEQLFKQINIVTKAISKLEDNMNKKTANDMLTAMNDACMKLGINQ